MGGLGRGSCKKVGITGLVGKCFVLECEGGVSWPRELYEGGDHGVGG